MARRNSEQAFSLFAFQDIITATIGVLVLVMILLSFFLSQVGEAARAAASEQQDNGSLTEPLEELKSKIAKDRDKIAELNETLRQQEELADSIDQRLADEKQEQQDLFQRVNEIGQGFLAARREYDKTKAQTDEIVPDLRETVEKLDATAQANRERLDHLQRTGFVNVQSAGNEDYESWIVDIQSQQILVQDFKRTMSHTFPKDPNTEFKRWLQEQRGLKTHLVLCVRPDAIGAYSTAARLVDETECQTGLLVLGSEDSVVLLE